jgi:hypothetical protein
MKFKKKIQMFEDFASSADASNSTTPSSATTKTTVAVDKTNTKSGEAIRQEVIKDVDTILTNLAELSNQITEEITTEVDQIVESFYTNFEMINEASFLETMMAQIVAVKNFATLKAAYPAKKKAIAEAEVEKTAVGAEFDVDSGETKEKAIQALKDKWEEKINQTKEKFADNPAKKQAALGKLRELRDEAIKQAEGGSIKAKIDAKKQQLMAGEDNKINDLKTDLADFEKKFAIANAEAISKQWEKQKADIDTEINQWQIEANVEAQTKFADDPELAEKAKDKAEQQLKDEAKKAKERAKELEADLKAAEQKMADAEAEAMNDPDKKEAVVAIKTYYGASQKYIGALSSAADEPTDEEMSAINAAKKELSVAKKELTAGKLVKAGEAENNEEGEELIANLNGAVDAAIEQFAAKTAKADAAKKAQLTKAKENTKKAEEAIKGLEADVTSAAEGDEKKAAKEALLRKKIEIQELKKIEAGLQDKDTSKMDAEIQRLNDEISNLSSGGGDDLSKSPQEVANEFIAQNPDYKIVENPDEEVSYTENGEEKSMKKWTDLQDKFGKDAEGNDTEEVVKVGKLAEVPENSSVNVPVGEPLTESFAFKSGSVADRFRSLM